MSVPRIPKVHAAILLFADRVRAKAAAMNPPPASVPGWDVWERALDAELLEEVMPIAPSNESVTACESCGASLGQPKQYFRYRYCLSCVRDAVGKARL